MSAIYDNWERLVAAVLRKEQLWQLCHADSIDLSTRSESLTSDLAATASSSILGSASPYQQSLNPATFSRDVLLGKNEEYEEAFSVDHQDLGSPSPELVSPRERFAIPYRLVMDNGITTVVKRLRDENVAPHEVFFSYNYEMLIIYEYENQSGVSTFLQHGKKKFEMYALDWEPCARIAISVARAIFNTHLQRNNKFDRGDTKAANDCFSDLGLEISIVIPTAGYRAPEVDNDRPPSQASDMYSFGVLLIELLTGAFPVMNGNVDERMELVRRVSQKFLEAGTLIVFDFVPATNPAALIQMWKMLLLAMRCLEEDPEQRPKSSDVVKMMEHIKSDVPPKNGN